MADREKVVDGLTDLKRFLPSTMWEPINDALAMLKEREAVEPKITTLPKKDHDDSYIYRCGNCDMIIFKSHKYCPFCGKAVKWK